MRACLSAHAWKGLLDHTALPNFLLVTFRFYIYCLELANPATPRTLKTRDANRREGGTDPFKNLAGLAIIAWQAKRLLCQAPAGPASRPPCCMPGTQSTSQEPSAARLPKAFQWELNYLLTT